MQDRPLTLPAIIPDRLRQFERGRKFVALLRGLGESILVFCAGLLLVAFLEWILTPHFSTRAWLSGINYFISFAFCFYRVILPLILKRPLRQVAWSFETAAESSFQERIVSAVELAESVENVPPGVSTWMMGRTIELAAEEIRAVSPARLLDSRPAVKAWKRATGVLFVLAVACLIPGFVPHAWLALNPYASAAHLSRIQILVTPGNCRVKQGTPLEIKASAPNLPEQVKVNIRWDDGFQESVSMSRSGTNEFALGLSAVSQGFRYAVQTADAESDLFTVKVDVPPRLAHLQLLIEYPAYAHWTNRLIEGGSADFLAGSRIRLLLETAEEKVADADWISDIPELRKFKLDNNRLTLELQPTNPITYQIRLTGANKLQAEPPQKWTLQPVPDEPPSARLAAIGAEPGMVQRDEILPLQAEATDDVGLKRVDLVVLNKEAETAVKPVYSADQQSPKRGLKTAIHFNLADLNALAGEEVQFQLVATDLRDQTTRSEPLSFTVGSPDKAVEAQLALRLRGLVSALAAQADYLQQTRASWLSIARNYSAENPNAQRPALAVLKSRLNEFGSEMDSLGRWLVDESETNTLHDARFMYRLGTTISAWGIQQREIMLANCGHLEQDTGTNVYGSFNLGRELFSRALLDMDHYKKIVSVLQGVFETDVLATRCDSAQGRYKRGLPVLRGENFIAPLGKTGAGLMASFFEGQNLDGKLIEQKVDNPRFDNYAPGGHHDQWSARYEGEINVPEEAEWTLACVADDGVRLTVDGKSLLPAEAWSAHPATQYKADVKLAAGWHPVLIEFFQASGESKLQVLEAKKGEPLQEVPLQSFRPPPTPNPNPDIVTNAALSSIAKDALKDRVKTSLTTTAQVPPALAPLTNIVQNENLTRQVKEKFPLGDSLTTNLLAFASWPPDLSHKSEEQADQLTGLSKDAQRILREELEKYRWRFEGSAALKPVQNAIQELREINQELRQQPYHNKKTLTEQEQAKVQLAKTWEKELQRASAEASHQFFETAKQKDATLAERTAALNATTKVDKDLVPSIGKLAATLDENRNKDDMAGQVDQRLNEISERYRELNDLQEKINREQVAAEARKALPSARSFERAQQASAPPNLPEKYDRMKQSVAEVLKAERIAGDYQEATKLQSLAGDSPQDAKGKETTRLIRDLANRTDRNPPSLAQSIPPPMHEETQTLEQHTSTPQDSANRLAKPRLAMALENSRLAQQGDRKTAVAYGLLGEDLGALVDSPDKLTSATLQPLADRAAALAGEKGEEARQAEIRAANERLRQLADAMPADSEALAQRLEALSGLAKQAAGEAPKRAPLTGQLHEMEQLAPPPANWSESIEPREIAAGAAHESSNEIQDAPNQWESYNDSSQILADAAHQIRMDRAVSDLAELNPYPMPQSAAEALAQSAPSSAEKNGAVEGNAGQALTQLPPKGIDQAEWARLNDRLRQAIRSSGIENFAEEHQAAIRAYFERLSSDGQKAK